MLYLNLMLSTGPLGAIIYLLKPNEGGGGVGLFYCLILSDTENPRGVKERSSLNNIKSDWLM